MTPISRFFGKPAMRPRCMIGGSAHESEWRRVKHRTDNTTQRQVWVCDVCNKQIYTRKQISKETHNTDMHPTNTKLESTFTNTTKT